MFDWNRLPLLRTLAKSANSWSLQCPLWRGFTVFSLEREWLQLSRYSRRDKVPLVLKHLYTVCHTGHKVNTVAWSLMKWAMLFLKITGDMVSWWRSNWLTVDTDQFAKTTKQLPFFTILAAIYIYIFISKRSFDCQIKSALKVVFTTSIREIEAVVALRDGRLTRQEPLAYVYTNGNSACCSYKASLRRFQDSQ